MEYVWQSTTHSVMLKSGYFIFKRGTAVAQWLRCCATKWKGRWFDPSWCQWIFHWHKILPIALWPWGSTQPLTEMSTGSIYWGKGGRCVRLTTYHHPVPLSRKSWNLNFLEPSGPVQACNGTAVPLPYFIFKRFSLLLPFQTGPGTCTVSSTLSTGALSLE